MVLNVLIIPLLAGFFFITHSPFHRYEINNYDGQRLILTSALFGLYFLAPAYVVTFFIHHCYPGLIKDWHDFVKIPYSGTSLEAFFIGLASTGIFQYGQRDVEKVKAIYQGEDAIEMLLVDAYYDNRLISITLKNNKVYVGSLIGIFYNHLSNSTKSISIIPMQSGYRDEISKKIIFTTYYSKTYKSMKENPSDFDLTSDDFNMAIKMSEIISINIFDSGVYGLFQDDGDDE